MQRKIPRIRMQWEGGLLTVNQGLSGYSLSKAKKTLSSSTTLIEALKSVTSIERSDSSSDSNKTCVCTSYRIIDRIERKRSIQAEHADVLYCSSKKERGSW
jgi:hypothetical protein